MKVYVTGGAGFVGRAVVQELVARGHDVWALVRDKQAAEIVLSTRVHLVGGDLANPDLVRGSLRDFQPEALVHLAWEGLPDYSEAMSRKNLALGTALYALAADCGVSTLLTTGSCWEYEARLGVLSEDALLGTSKAFPSAKSALRTAGLQLAKDRGVSFFWLRLFYVYGAGQHGHSLLPTLIAAAQNGLEPAIRAPGNRNDFVHVSDVARMLGEVLEQRPLHDTYNVGSGVTSRVADVAATVFKLCGAPLPDGLTTFLEQEQHAAPAEDFCADMARAREDLAFETQVDLAQGVGEMLRHAGLSAEDSTQ